MQTSARTVAMDHLRRRLLHLWESRGGGFYGFVAALTFLWLEAADLAGELAGLPGSVSLDPGWLISWMVRGLVDAAMNVMWAAMWPVSWMRTFGTGPLLVGLLGSAYLAYRLIREPVRRLLAPRGEGEAAPAPGAALGLEPPR